MLQRIRNILGVETVSRPAYLWIAGLSALLIPLAVWPSASAQQVPNDKAKTSVKKTGGLGTSETVDPLDLHWGEAVAGVQCRLRADVLVWPSNTVPELKADVRNRGKGELSVAQAQQLCELEVDGAWYQWHGPVEVKSSAFGPGRHYEDIPIRLDKN
jgi:hypothetical protein